MPGVTVMRTSGVGPAGQRVVYPPDDDDDGGDPDTAGAERRLRMLVVTNSKGHMELNLHGRGLRQVPVQVFHMSGVHVLRLARNHLDHLPLMISYLRSLRVLDLSQNLLAQLPETLVNCRRLTRLDVSHNRLAGLPRTVGGLRELRHLSLAGNVLEQLPQEVGQLSALRVLNLHGNRLWHLPPSLEGLRHLARLDLGDNLLDNVPLVVTRITSLKALDLSRNRLAGLPLDTDRLRGLVELNLSHNKFLTITSLLTSLTRLKYLSLAGNGLKFLPVHMDRLQNLEVLHLQDNKLRHLPSLPSSLRYYNVSKNQLGALTVEGMRNLVSLTATHNHLDAAPRGVFKLRRLKFLYLDNNRLEELPSELGLLTELRVLALANNDLRRLPHRAMLCLGKLASFNVKGNHRLTRRKQEQQQEEMDNAHNADGLRGEHHHHGKIKSRDGQAGGSRGKDDDDVRENVKSNSAGGNKRREKPKAVVATKGKITFDDDVPGFTAPDRSQYGNASDNDQGTRPRQRTQRATEDHRLNHSQSVTFPRSASKSRLLSSESHSSHSATRDKQASKRFNSIRSLRDIFFGRPKKKISKSASQDGREESSINSETRAAMRPSDSLHLPMNYHMDDIERGGDGTSSWNPRRFSFETRNSSLPRRSHRSPRSYQTSPESTLERLHNQIRQSQHPMKTRMSGDVYAQGDNFRSYPDMSYRSSQTRSRGRSREISPDLYYGDSDTKRYQHYSPQSDNGYGRSHQQRHSKSYTQRDASRNQGQKAFRKNNTFPLQFKASQSWADQGYSDRREFSPRPGGPFHSGYDSSSTGLSWHRWGRPVPASVQPSREHSVREVYASFATESPHSEERYPRDTVLRHRAPEAGYTSPSEDGGYASNLRSYRSEPTLYSEEDMGPSGPNHFLRGEHPHRRIYSSDDSLLNQEFGGRRSMSRHGSVGKHSHRHHHHRTRSVSSMSDTQSHRHSGHVRSSSMTFLHPGDIPRSHLREPSQSSLVASRITDYIDCEDTPSSATPSALRSTAHESRGHFSQFDHILSTASPVEMAAQTLPGSPRLTPVALQHGHFIMRKKTIDQPQMKRTRSLDSILDYSPRNTNLSSQGSQHQWPNPKADGGADMAEMAEDQRGNKTAVSAQHDMMRDGGDKQANTDYSLLGVCNHVETMLNQNLLRPGIRFTNTRGGHRFSEKPFQRNQSDPTGKKTALHSSRTSHSFPHQREGDDNDEEDYNLRASAMEYSQPQTFTLTSEGGQFMSSGQPEIMVDIPAHAVRRNLNITMQLLSISPQLLLRAQEVNHFVSNIFSLGPLVHFYTDRPDVTLNSPATTTVPAPPAVKGGHLVVLSVRRDNSCLPVSSGYRSGHTSATLTTWHFSGKIALITRAKCKYKACKSMEQLLQCIGATQI